MRLSGIRNIFRINLLHLVGIGVLLPLLLTKKVPESTEEFWAPSEPLKENILDVINQTSQIIERREFIKDSTHFVETILPILKKDWPKNLAREEHASLVLDSKGRTLWAKNADQPRRPASISKLMTFYIVMEKIENGELTWDDKVFISKIAGDPSLLSRGDLKASQLDYGDQPTLKDLIYRLMVLSDNNAATAIAEHISNYELLFGELMTQKAQELGMCSTSFHFASGMPGKDMNMSNYDDNISTAKDLAVLLNRVYQDFPQHTHILQTYEYLGLKNTAYRHIDNNYVLGKTGRTNKFGSNIALLISPHPHADIKDGYLSQYGGLYTIIFIGADRTKNRDKMVNVFKDGIYLTQADPQTPTL